MRFIFLCVFTAMMAASCGSSEDQVKIEKEADSIVDALTNSVEQMIQESNTLDTLAPADSLVMKKGKEGNS